MLLTACTRLLERLAGGRVPFAEASRLLRLLGHRLPPRTIEIMIRKRRRTLVVCPSCHDSIHNRQPNAEAAFTG